MSMSTYNDVYNWNTEIQTNYFLPDYAIKKGTIFRLAISRFSLVNTYIVFVFIIIIIILHSDLTK